MPIFTPEWVKDAVFYQIFPDRFARSGRVEPPGELEPWDAAPTLHGFKGGDLFGVAARLDELTDLGITALYLNPVFASASNHRYHTYDYLRVDPLLGGDEALRELLDAAHARGMRVILDGVFNHASRGFWPFNHVLECGIASPYVNWFHVDRDALAAGRPLRAYPDETLREAIDAAGGPAQLGIETTFALGYHAWWNMPALPKLNTDNPQVREYLMRVAEHWIRFGADGWRLDVAAEIDDDEFWREFRRRVKAANPDAYIVAEVWHEDQRWLRGDQFDGYMNYPLAFAILSFAAGAHRDQGAIDAHGDVREGLRHDDGAGFLGRVEHQLRLYDPEVVAVQLNVLGTHDTARILTICGGDADGVRLATLAQLTLPGAPCLYYGDELGMAGGMEPASRAAFPVDPAAGDRELRAFVRGLVRLRHAHPALRRGSFAAAGASGTAAAYVREGAGEAFLVALNAGDEPVSLDLRLAGLDGRVLEPAAEGWAWPPTASVRIDDGTARIDLAARSAALLAGATGG
jgi:cyclomaltodextrinase / maltogenic alpha-amylase / neopullulanase